MCVNSSPGGIYITHKTKKRKKQNQLRHHFVTGETCDRKPFYYILWKVEWFSIRNLPHKMRSVQNNKASYMEKVPFHWPKYIRIVCMLDLSLPLNKILQSSVRSGQYRAFWRWIILRSSVRLRFFLHFSAFYRLTLKLNEIPRKLGKENFDHHLKLQWDWQSHGTVSNEIVLYSRVYDANVEWQVNTDRTHIKQTKWTNTRDDSASHASFSLTLNVVDVGWSIGCFVLRHHQHYRRHQHL